MIRLIRDFRFVPLVLVATISLFVLKTFGLVFDGGYTLNELARRGADEGDVTGSVGAQRRVDLSADDPRLVQPAPASRPPARRSWAQESFGYPDVPGAIAESKPAEPPPPPKGNPNATVQPAP